MVIDSEMTSVSKSSVGKQTVSDFNQKQIDEGIKLLFESISVTRDVSKTLITTSLSAIPTYIALYKLNPTKSMQSDTHLLPPIAFLVAALLFILSYLPTHYDIDLRIPSTVEDARKKIVRHRLIGIYLGSVAFFGAATTAIYFLMH